MVVSGSGGWAEAGVGERVVAAKRAAERRSTPQRIESFVMKRLFLVEWPWQTRRTK